MVSKVFRCVFRIYYFLLSIMGGRSVGVRAIILSEDLEKVLLVHHTYCSGWYLPGGGVKKGEHPASAVVREIYEETGVKCLGEPEFFQVCHQKYMGIDDYPLIYSVQNWVQEKIKKSPEIKEIKWVSLFALPQDTDPLCLECIQSYCFREKEVQEEWPLDESQGERQ